MGGSFVIQYTIDQSLFALAVSAFNGLLGVATMILGLTMLRRRPGEEATSREIQVQRELMLWGIDARDLQDEAGWNLVRRINRLSAWPSIGVGLGWFAANVCLCVAAFVFTGSFAILVANFYPVLTVEFIFVAVGATLSVTWGAYVETRHAPSATAYSDVRTRRLPDYCAWWFGWAPVAFATITVALLWMIVTHSSTIQIETDNAYLSLPLLPTVGAFLAVAVFIPVFSMLSIRRIIDSPRMLLAVNPQVARTADDSRRATAIGVILGFAWMASGCLLQVIVLIDVHHYVAHGRTVVANLLSVPFFLGGFISILGGALLFLHGRLGGTLTGWRNPFATLRYLEHGQEL